MKSFAFWTLVIEKMEAIISWYFSICFLGQIMMASRKGIWHVILYPSTFVGDNVQVEFDEIY
jgi:hypothetical protein